MFSRRWWITSLLVLAGIGLTIRLGIWQVERYQQNKAFADHLSAMQAAAPLTLGPGAQSAGLTGMEYRAVSASGIFDFSHEIAVRNQIWEQSWGNETGYILVAPLVFADGTAVLVDRGWIPLEDNSPAAWQEFDISGSITVSGIIRLPAKPQMGGTADPTLAPGQTGLKFWTLINIERLQKQMPYHLLPIYIEQAPTRGNQAQPYRSLSDPDTTAAGTNLGFASMWFGFTALLFFGYPLYLRRQTRDAGVV